MKINIQKIDWEQTIPIRHSVLWPNKLPKDCFIKGDEDACHFGAYVDGKLVSVASIYRNGSQARLRKFATEKGFQNRGIGSKLLTHTLLNLKQKGLSYFWCDARESALDFYIRFGLKTDGARFYKSGIAYYKMFRYV